MNKKKIRKMMSQKFHKWLKVFEKTESKKMLVRKPQDHIINLKEKRENICNTERKKRESYFVGKKNTKKRIVQDYKYLNKRIIKNNCPLPLILDLIDTMGTWC